jgi:hypothetical protein
VVISSDIGVNMRKSVIKTWIIALCVVGFFTAICIKDRGNAQVLVNFMAVVITIGGIIGIVEMFSSFIEGFIIHHNDE